jgi:glycyl-tRNA synthetase beta chain
VEIEERKDKMKYSEGEIDPEHMPHIEERSLLRALSRVGKRTEIFLKEWKFELAMATLATLRQPIDAFFEQVTVNTANKKLRANRLLLLSRIRSTFNQVADFSRVEG